MCRSAVQVCAARLTTNIDAPGLPTSGSCAISTITRRLVQAANEWDVCCRQVRPSLLSWRHTQYLLRFKRRFPCRVSLDTVGCCRRFQRPIQLGVSIQREARLWEARTLDIERERPRSSRKLLLSDHNWVPHDNPTCSRAGVCCHVC